MPTKVFVTLLAALPLASMIAGCGDSTRACTDEHRSTPVGTISWSDGEPRVPDRVYAYYAGSRGPVECEITPPAASESAVSYSCGEGSGGSARLRVLLDAEYWDTPFEVVTDGCHAELLELDVELDPDAGTSLGDTGDELPDAPGELRALLVVWGRKRGWSRGGAAPKSSSLCVGTTVVRGSSRVCCE